MRYMSKIQLFKTLSGLVLAILFLSSCGEKPAVNIQNVAVIAQSSPTSVSTQGPVTNIQPTRTSLPNRTSPIPTPTLVSAVIEFSRQIITGSTAILTLTNGSTVSVITPTIKMGEMLRQPLLYGSGVILKANPNQPTTSHFDALKAIYDFGIANAYGGKLNGRTLNISMIYGLATVGTVIPTYNLAGVNPNIPEECKTWSGPCNVPMRICQNGSCVPTGEIVTRIIDRPMWIVEYTNIARDDILVSVPLTPPCAAKGTCPPPGTGRAIYQVDEKTKTVLDITLTDR